jgi:hypothetical protein
MHRMRWRVVVVVLALGGCSMYRAQPARIMVPPVIPGVVVPATTDEASGTGAGGAGTATSAPEQPVASPRSLPVQPSRQLADGSRVPAVQGLLTTAEKERRNGRLEAASVALERAQRLAPQSALVYQRLAEIRLQQKRAAEAEQFARKGMGVCERICGTGGIVAFDGRSAPPTRTVAVGAGGRCACRRAGGLSSGASLILRGCLERTPEGCRDFRPSP